VIFLLLLLLTKAVAKPVESKSSSVD
jgi:hypothetical protein